MPEEETAGDDGWYQVCIEFKAPIGVGLGEGDTAPQEFVESCICGNRSNVFADRYRAELVNTTSKKNQR